MLYAWLQGTKHTQFSSIISPTFPTANYDDVDGLLFSMEERACILEIIIVLERATYAGIVRDIRGKGLQPNYSFLL
jgi:hypothetical protein